MQQQMMRQPQPVMSPLQCSQSASPSWDGRTWASPPSSTPSLAPTGCSPVTCTCVVPCRLPVLAWARATATMSTAIAVSRLVEAVHSCCCSAGTTRDSVRVSWEFDGRQITLVDTAGELCRVWASHLAILEMDTVERAPALVHSRVWHCVLRRHMHCRHFSARPMGSWKSSRLGRNLERCKGPVVHCIEPMADTRPSLTLLSPHIPETSHAVGPSLSSHWRWWPPVHATAHLAPCPRRCCTMHFFVPPDVEPGTCRGPRH